jgi:hypothetical protein
MLATALFTVLLAGANLSPDLERQVERLLPRPAEERWLQIPWQRNVMRARVLAEREGKPMFLWVMNGNPLGCT